SAAPPPRTGSPAASESAAVARARPSPSAPGPCRAPPGRRGTPRCRCRRGRAPPSSAPAPRRSAPRAPPASPRRCPYAEPSRAARRVDDALVHVPPLALPAQLALELLEESVVPAHPTGRVLHPRTAGELDAPSLRERPVEADGRSREEIE